MLKRLVLICLSTTCFTLAGQAAEGAKTLPTQAPAVDVKPNEAIGKIAVPESAPVAAQKKNPKWSDTHLNLTHCLNRESNTAIIKCAH